MKSALLKQLLTRLHPIPKGDKPLGPPWFDMENATSLLEKRRKSEKLTDEEFEQLRHWAEHGYIVLRDCVPAADMNGMQQDLDRVWTTRDPIDGLVISDIRIQDDDPPGLTHERLVTLDEATKEKIKRTYPWRIHSFCLYSPATNRIFYNAQLIRWCSLIFARQAFPINTINFEYGSSQKLHQDTAVFY